MTENTLTKAIEPGNKSPGSLTPEEMRAKCLAFMTEFNQWVFGYEFIGKGLLTSLLMPGRVRHIYGLGMPGLAKSHTMEVIGCMVSGLVYKRVQCNSDLTPSMLAGGPVLNPETRKMEILKGEIVDTNLVHADEINRATPNAQGGFLQAMAEGKVSLPGMPTIPMLDPFVVLATANPAEQKGVYPLPEAQLDRFLFQLNFPYTEEEYAKQMLMRDDLTDGSAYAKIAQVMTRDELLSIRQYIKENVYVSRAFIDYLYELVDCTRPGQKYFEKLVGDHGNELLVKGKPELGKVEEVMAMIMRGEEWGGGGGPRAEQCLKMASKIYAFLYGKDSVGNPRYDHVAPEDLQPILNAVLRHRLILNPEAKWPSFQTGPVTTDQVINVIKDKIKPVSDPSVYKQK